MARRHIVSEHRYRRTARWRKNKLEREQKVSVHDPDWDSAQALLRKYGVHASDALTVEKAVRGPARYVVVAYTAVPA